MDILVPGAVASAEVQYWTRGMTEAAAYEVGSITQQTDGSYVIECNVPNEFFDTWGDLRVYLVVTDDSKYVVTYEGRIKVLQREKPEDYVDDDPDNEALRVLTEAREAAQSASADADRAAQVAASIPADYSELSGNVSNLTGEVGQLNERLDNSIRVKVSPDKTTFFEGTENLFNANDPEVTTTGYYDRSNTLVSANYIRTTGYIPVIPGDKYVSSFFGKSQFILWFTQDNSDGFSGFTNLIADDTNVAVPNGIYYAKFIFDIRYVSTFGIYHASTAQTYTPSGPQIKRDYLKNVFPVQADELSIINPTVNLFNPNDPDVLIRQYYDRTNTLQTSTRLGQSGYIPVEPLKPYAFAHNAGGFALWYDSDKTFLGYSDYLVSDIYVTALPNANFMRLIFVIAEEGSFSVNEGTTLAPYEAYHTPIIKTEFLPNTVSPFNDLTGVAFGTSLTYRAQTTGGFLQYLPGLSGINFDNQGVGSATILSNGVQPAMLPVITGYTGYSGKRVCILEGFVNDWYYNGESLGTWKDTQQTTVCGCVRYALNHILTQNPDLTVFLVLDHYGKGITAPNAVNSANQTQFEFYQEIEKVALSMGIRVIKEYELSEISNLTPQYLLDNIHMNALGAKQSANAIWSGMKDTYPNEVSA